MTSLTRRNFLRASAAAAVGSAALGATDRFSRVAALPAPAPLKVSKREADLVGSRPTEVLTYGDQGMPPVLRLRRGELFRAQLANFIDEPTTVHWHGLRIANAMDGVPFMTQPYVYPGDSFDYAFVPPDAGTFWYHPHCNTLEQMGHGLTGVLVVEDRDDPAFDGEIVLNLRDWRLDESGKFLAPFRPRDAARTGTYGTVRTANWQQQPVYDVPAGGLVRLRVAITDVTRIYAFGVEGGEARVIALDGNPVAERFTPQALQLGPGQRLDLAVRMPDQEGAIVGLRDLRGTKSIVLAGLRAVGPTLRRDLREVAALSSNPVKPCDVNQAVRIPLVLSATAENAPSGDICGALGYSFWAINKRPWPGDTRDPTTPLAELKLGRSYIVEMANTTPQLHPIHLHGMSFTLLKSNKRTLPPLVSDTFLILPDEKVELGLVADNPGDWLFHCHVIEHQKSGMTSYLRVA